MVDKNKFATTSMLRRMYHILLEHDEGLLFKDIVKQFTNSYTKDKVKDGLTFLCYIQVIHKIPTLDQKGFIYKLDDSYFEEVKK